MNFKSFFSIKKNDEKKSVENKKQYNTVKDYIPIDINNLESYNKFFTPNYNIAGKIYLEANIKIQGKQFELFDALKILIHENGERSFTLEGDFSFFLNKDQTLSYINLLYKGFGPDEKGNVQISTESKTKLLNSRPNYNEWITWKNPYIDFSSSTNRISSSFTVSNEYDKNIKEDFYNKLTQIDKDGLLVSRKTILNQTEASFIKDDFTKDLKVFITKIAGITQEYLPTYSLSNSYNLLAAHYKIGISFLFLNNSIFVRLISFNKEFLLAKNDGIIFLFDSDKTISLKFLTEKVSNEPNVFRNVHSLTLEDIKLFSFNKLLKWKLTSISHGSYCVGGFINHNEIKEYKVIAEGQYLLQTMMRNMIKAVTANTSLFSELLSIEDKNAT